MDLSCLLHDKKRACVCHNQPLSLCHCAGAVPLAMDLLRSPAKQESEVGRSLLKVLAQDADVAAELKAARIRL